MKKYRIRKGKAYLGRVELKKKYHPCHWVALPTEALLMYKPKADKILKHFNDGKMELEEVETPKKKNKAVIEKRMEHEIEYFLLNDVGEFGR